VLRRHMPKAVVELSDHANRVVNVVKARDGLRGKSEAIESIVAAYEEIILEPSLRPQLVAELRRIRQGKFRKVQSLDELLENSR
jgi:predicted Ser/Thr protein kinase